jgi:HD-GYP domain-containing protein (c-di-GMP phosphodiesterase class II)
MLIGAKMDFSSEDLNTLRYSSEIHDIGKISIPDFILNKPGKLNNLERRMIELHPVKGAQIISPLEFLKDVIPIVRHHHERFDGNGYPDGLRAGRIPLMARILACADSYDAMTSERPYKEKMSLQEAIREIKRNAGSQFDPEIAALFVKILKSNPADR